MDIFQLSGELVNTLVDRNTQVCSDDLYFPEENSYLVRLTCEGNGGAGDFEMLQAEPVTAPYKLASTETLDLKGKNYGLYSIELVAGKRYEFLVQGAQYMDVDLIDGDGQFLVSQSLTFDGVVYHYFTPTKTGRHRLWLRGLPGTSKFELRVHTAPKMDH